MRTDVIVVGAGPAGLLLAGELALGGARVTVLERRTGPITESRASTLHARTMELFDQRGLLDRLDAPPPEPRGHFAGLPLDLSGTASEYAGLWKVPQARTEQVLLGWATGLGATVLTGHEVTGLDDHGDHVTVRTPAGRWRADYVVGCDGEDSTVRTLAGFELAGSGARREIFRADLTGVDLVPRRFERLPGGLAVAARLPSGVTRVMVHEHGRAPVHRTGAPAFAEVCAAWQRVTGEDVSAATPVWVNAFDDTCRQVTRYRRGRVLLAGDAAHRQLPVGGQALNLALQDAANLGWKLAARIRGDAPDGLLDSYHDERHPIGARVLTGITAQAMLLFGAGAEIDAARAVVGELLRHPAARDHLAATVSGTDTGRVPPCKVETPDGPRSVAEALRDGRFLLLTLTGGTPPGSPSPRVRVLPATTTDSSLGHLLIRPDGELAAVGPEPAPSAETLARWVRTA